MRGPAGGCGGYSAPPIVLLADMDTWLALTPDELSSVRARSCLASDRIEERQERLALGARQPAIRFPCRCGLVAMVLDR